MPSTVPFTGIPGWIPPERGTRHHLGRLGRDLPMLRAGGVHLMDTALWLPNHRHRFWELHYLHRGRLEVEFAAGGRGLAVRGGSFVLTRPRAVHRARDGIMAPCHLVWLQLDLALPDAARGSPFTAADLRRLRTAFAARADSVWPAPAEADAVFRRLRDLLAGPSDAWAEAALRAAIADLLLLAVAPAAGAAFPPALRRALDALAADPCRPCTVAAAAAQAGISPAQVHALCVRHLGTTPAAWQLARRLDAAREAIAGGEAVGSVAARFGFSSPRYFAYAFRREVGVPPSLYAQARAAARTGGVHAW